MIVTAGCVCPCIISCLFECCRGSEKYAKKEGTQMDEFRRHEELQSGEEKRGKDHISRIPTQSPGAVTQQLLLLYGATITFMQSNTQPHQQQLPAATVDQSGHWPWLQPRPEGLTFSPCQVWSVSTLIHKLLPNLLA